MGCLGSAQLLSTPGVVVAIRLIRLVRLAGGGMLSRVTGLARRRRFGAFAPNFLRVLIEAQSHKAGLAQLAVLRPLRKGDLGHEGGCHPMDVCTPRWIVLVKRRSFLQQGIQSLAQVAQYRAREASADFARIHQ